MAIRCALIVAMAEDRVIGLAGGMPWRLPEDLKRFRTLTMGKPIIMGRKTHESIGHPLPGRANIVVSGNSAYSADGVISVGSIDAALERAESIAREDGVDEIMVIGGAAIYGATLEHAERLYLTEIHEKFEGDTYFPDLDRDAWQEMERSDHPASGEAPAFSFFVLDRVAG